MPLVHEMSDAEVVAAAADPWTFGGSATNHKHDLVKRAITLAPDDPSVIANALSLWHYFAMPVPDGYSSVGPSRADGIPLHRQALADAERIVERTTAFDTPALRAVFFWAKTTRALLRIIAPSVSADELALAIAECAAVQREILDTPEVGDEKKRIQPRLRKVVLARITALQLLAAGAPYPPDLLAQLRDHLAGWDSNFGWPIAPLAQDAGFRAWLTSELAARTAAKLHPAPTLRTQLDEIVTRHPGTREELEGRVLVWLWTGIDQATFLHAASAATDARLAWVLDRLLALGFSVTTETRGGSTLLHNAVAVANIDAITRLIAAGADPHQKLNGASALDIATKKKQSAVIAALQGAAPTQESAFVRELRAAAAALDPASLAWIGSTFGISAPSPTAILDAALTAQPSSAKELLAAATPLFVFDRYVIARVLRDAGYIVDVNIAGGALTRGVTASGTLTVDGDVADAMDATLVTAGDLVVHGGMITEGDTIVGGDLRARDYVWGNYNDGSLVVAGGVTAPLVVMTDHTFECEGEHEVERTVVDDTSEHRTIFVPAILDEHASPDYAKARALIDKGAPVILGVVPAAPAAKEPAAKKPAAKKPAAKPAAKKPAAKPAAKKPAAKPAAKKPAAKKPAAKKPAAKKPVAKPAPKKSVAKPAAKKR